MEEVRREENPEADGPHFTDEQCEALARWYQAKEDGTADHLLIPSALKTVPAYVVSPEWDDKRLVALPTTERQDGTSVAYARNARRKVRIEESLHAQLSLGRIQAPDVKTLWSHFQTALAQQNVECPEKDAEWDSEVGKKWAMKFRSRFNMVPQNKSRRQLKAAAERTDY